MFLVNRKLQKLKIRRGTDLQRKLVIFEDGELVFTTDTQKLYIGDGNSTGGILISNRGYIVDVAQLDVSNPPSYLNKNDILFNNRTNICYIVDFNEGSLFLREISSSFDINSLSAIKISTNSVSAAQLSWNSVKPNGGLGLDPISGLYVDYDSNQFAIVNGYLTILSNLDPTKPNYTFDTTSGGFSIDSNNSISVKVDNSTVKIKDNKLTGLGTELSGVNTTDFQTFTATKDSGISWINCDTSINVTNTTVNPGSEFRFVSLSGQNTFTIVSTGNTFQSDFIGTVFRIINYNYGQNTNTIYSRAGMRVTSISGSSAMGIIYGGTSNSNVNIVGTGDANGITIKYEPRIRNSKNIKWVLQNASGDYTVFFDKPYDDSNYSMSFGTKAYTAFGDSGLAKQTIVTYSSIENPQTNKIRIETGYDTYNFSGSNSWTANDCSVLNLIFKGKSINQNSNKGTNITLDSSNFIYNYVLNADLISQGWDGISPIDVTVTVPSGVTIGSNAANLPAFTINQFPDGSNITLINNGTIVGRGGDGGSGGWNYGEWVYGHNWGWFRIFESTSGSDGGTAIKTEYNIKIINNGIIGGGGGGGGGGGVGYRGDDVGPGLRPVTTVWLSPPITMKPIVIKYNPWGAAYEDNAPYQYNRTQGFAGTNLGIGGAGGAGKIWYGGAGGNPGGIGQAGTRGNDSDYSSGAPGGAAGAYIVGNANVTWTVLGDVRGIAN